MGRIGFMLLTVFLSAALVLAGCGKASNLAEVGGLSEMKELTAEEILENLLLILKNNMVLDRFGHLRFK